MRNRIYLKTESSAVFTINLLRINDIKIYSVRNRDGICFFSINEKDYAKFTKVFDCHGKTFEIVKGEDRIDKKKKILQRAGVFAGILVLIAVGILLSEIVTDISVSGNRLLNEEEIIDVITNGEKLPLFKSKLNLRETEGRLIQMEGLSAASLEIKGNSLSVRVLEELEKPFVIDYSQKKNVVSRYDAIITSIVAFTGTPLCSVGDTVKKGEVLIDSTEAAENGEKRDILATGSVYGRVWVTKSYVFTNEVIRSIRTGRSKTYIVGKYAKERLTVPFENYETEETNEYGKGMFKRITYYETEETREKFDYNGMKETIIKEKTEALEKELPEKAIKVRTWFSEKTVDKTTELVIYYEIITDLTE